MHYTKELTRCALGLLAGILLVSATQGCAVIGPSSLSRGRVAYAEVIAETNAEQSLATLVRLRYGAAMEPAGSIERYRPSPFQRRRAR